MSDVTLLRTLTRKSILKFGMFNDLTVQEVISSRGIKGIRLLTYYYYSCDKITFIEDILLEIGITEELRIPKPSKVNSEKLHEYQSIIRQKRRDEFLTFDEETKNKIIGISRKESAFVKNENKKCSVKKSRVDVDNLRMRNQGNFRNKQ